MAGTTVICVLGMHRSGTSLLTRILNLLGVYLGPEERLLAAAADNPKGFWEHSGLVEINEAVLATFGGRFDKPPAFPEDWPGAPELAGLRAQARAVVARDFGGADLWGWKDPRNCLTAPFWQRLLPPMRYVHCLRSPAEAAPSLRAQSRHYGTEFSQEKCVWLWLAYARSAFAHTLGRPHRLVCYEDLMADWPRELRGLAQFLGRLDRAERAEVRSAVGDFVDDGLRHHRGAPGPAGQGGGPRHRALALAQRLYDALRGGEAPAHDVIECTVREAQDVLAPELQRQDREAPQAHAERVRSATRELTALVPPGDTFILADEDRWDTGEMVAGRRRIPFLERDGRYWGKPADGRTAVRELERLRRAGAGFLVVGWPAFWWLECYAELSRHLGARYRCVLKNDDLLVFDLRPGGPGCP